MIAGFLENAGWSVGFLGSDMPHAGIVDAVLAQDSDLLCISATMRFNIPNVVRLIRDLRACSTKLRVLVGGAALRVRPDTWEDIGADGFASNLIRQSPAAQAPSRTHGQRGIRACIVR